MPDFTRKGRVEAAAVVMVYILFLIVGLHVQTAGIPDAVGVEILGPPDGVQLQSSPVELSAIITSPKGPLSNVSAAITVLSVTTGETQELAGATDGHGIIKVLFPAQSGNYSWYAATGIQGYPTIVSRPRSFSTRLTLIVDCLHPCSTKYPLALPRYLDSQVMVRDMDGKPVESANVTFYIDSTRVHSTLTNALGIATLFWSKIPPGSHTWFASASKDDKVGASRLSSFTVR